MKKLFMILIVLFIPKMSWAAFADSLNNLVIQCWGCPVFDRLFLVVSKATARFYDNFADLAFGVMVICLVVYLVYVAVKYLKKGSVEEYKKNIIPTMINAMIITIFLELGVSFPRTVASVVFEPVAMITNVYSSTIIGTTYEQTNTKVKYQPILIENEENNFYSVGLRDNVISLMKNNTVFFQNFILLGMASIDSSISFESLTSFTKLGQAILALFLGVAIVVFFFQLFCKFCFYFIDLLLDITVFAFFFPFILIGWLFQISNTNAVSEMNKDVSVDVTKIGSVGTSMVKNVIVSITTFIAVIVVYIIAFYILGFFLGDYMNDSADLIKNIMEGNYIEARNLISPIIFSGKFWGVLIYILMLGYFIRFFMKKIPGITQELMSEFGLSSARTSNSELVIQEVEKYYKNVKSVIEMLKGKK